MYYYCIRSSLKKDERREDEKKHNRSTDLIFYHFIMTCHQSDNYLAEADDMPLGIENEDPSVISLDGFEEDDQFDDELELPDSGLDVVNDRQTEVGELLKLAVGSTMDAVVARVTPETL